MVFIAVLAALLFVTEIILYVFLLPDPTQKPFKTRSLSRFMGKLAYLCAYILSLLRAPLGLLPYITKLFIFFVLKVPYDSPRSTYFREIINMLGDFFNLGVTFLFALTLVGPLNFHPTIILLFLPLGAEMLRILAERLPILTSASWQLLPHRRMAQSILAHRDSSFFWSRVAWSFTRYCRYYSLSDAQRLRTILQTLKCQAAWDTDLSNRLEYLRAFCIVPLGYGLRSGHVRDVALGEVFIHQSWTNDPWLLIGMAIRRAPWMFDPRYLRRPFYYMTEANRLATLLVLEHGCYSPPYAIFQFGHEIRVARLHFFYGVLRWLGLDIEEKVSADGTFQFDQFIFWVVRHLGQEVPAKRCLCTDAEAIKDIQHRWNAGETLGTREIAVQYTYPLKYVEEVILPALRVQSTGTDLNR
jgi:hypothetical protein